MATRTGHAPDLPVTFPASDSNRQDIATRWAERWFSEATPAAEPLYRAAAQGFVEVANSFLDRLAASTQQAKHSRNESYVQSARAFLPATRNLRPVYPVDAIPAGFTRILPGLAAVATDAAKSVHPLADRSVVALESVQRCGVNRRVRTCGVLVVRLSKLSAVSALPHSMGLHRRGAALTPHGTRTRTPNLRIPIY